MKKHQIIIFILIIVAGIGGVAGYFYYKDYKMKHQPNIEIATMTNSIPETVEVATQSIITQLVKPNDPQYTDVKNDSASLYPTLSGVYEAIWDGFESFPIDIVAYGGDTINASYRVIWAKKFLYIQVIVEDPSPDGYVYSETEPLKLYSKDIPGNVENPNTLIKQDSVEIFVNEDGNKNQTLLVGDGHYYISRKNDKLAGFGGITDYESVTYDLFDGNGVCNGYVVEAAIPLLKIKAQKNNSIGFEIKVNDVADGSVVGIKKWASSYLYDFQNFRALGTLTFK